MCCASIIPVATKGLKKATQGSSTTIPAGGTAVVAFCRCVVTHELSSHCPFCTRPGASLVSSPSFAEDSPNKLRFLVFFFLAQTFFKSPTHMVNLVRFESLNRAAQNGSSQAFSVEKASLVYVRTQTKTRCSMRTPIQGSFRPNPIRSSFLYFRVIPLVVPPRRKLANPVPKPLLQRASETPDPTAKTTSTERRCPRSTRA
jgi:hypothetical protein